MSLKRAIASLLGSGVAPLRIVRTSVDGWRANRLGALYDYVVRVATTSLPPGTRRYWFLDEITATEGAWWSVIKDLRDNTALRDDCMVLTGSSNRAGRCDQGAGGPAGAGRQPGPFPPAMSFRDFCRALGLAAPAVAALRPDELRTSAARAAWLELGLWTDDLVAA